MRTADAPQPVGDPAPFLELRQLSKAFGATQALASVNLRLRRAEVHVLAGENGAGKSTLIRILSGLFRDYGGQVILNGRTVRLESPRDAARHGIATIHQELSLVGAMTVQDNLTLSSEQSLWETTTASSRRKTAREILKLLDLDCDPACYVESLPLAQRQLLEIARALAKEAQLLIMDEPTSALSEPEAQCLFSQIERLRRQGKTILYISHRMDEIYRLADRISVLRDGVCVVSAPSASLSRTELVQHMVGREIAEKQAEQPVHGDRPRLELKGVRLRDENAHTVVSGLSLRVLPGEIVGMAGLKGSGASELLAHLGGALNGHWQGELCLDGLPYSPENPRHALARGVSFAPADRNLSVFYDLSIVENICLSSLSRLSRLGLISPRRERAAAELALSTCSVQAPSLYTRAVRLSGGNQQKLALLRCVATSPKLLLLDDPTRGIDIKAKADVYAIINKLSHEGVAVLFRSSETDELLRISHRIVVLFRSRIRAVFERPFSREAVLKAIMGAGFDNA